MNEFIPASKADSQIDFPHAVAKDCLSCGGAPVERSSCGSYWVECSRCGERGGTGQASYFALKKWNLKHTALKNLQLFGDGHSGARLSACRTWRYCLWRIWDKSKRTVAFIGLNPSTADESIDDPTIRRCMGFARRWGFGGIYMYNLFAFRATDPKNMKAASDAVGPDNDWNVGGCAPESGKIVCAWGVHGFYQGRDKEVLELLADQDLFCLGTTKDGHPKHPLYLRADSQVISFNRKEPTK